MRSALLVVLTLCGVVLPGCDSDNVSWAFVSNPSGTTTSEGGLVIVITKTSGSSAALAAGGRSLVERGSQSGHTVTVRLATTADVALIEHSDRVELRCPALPGRRVQVHGASVSELPGGAALWELAVPDASQVHRSALGRGRLFVARRGNVIVLEHAAGLVVFGDRAPVEEVPSGPIVDATRTHLQLVAAGLPARVLRGEGPPSVAQRAEWNEARRSIRLLGPDRELLAEVPQAAVTLAGGANGVFLHGTFPRGLGEDPEPFAILTPTDNRYLLRTELR